MKSNVNVFVGVVLCAVLCGTFVWLRSAGDEDTWKPNEIYDQVHSSSYSASYTNATFSGSPQDGGVALSMSSSSLSRKANFYAGAHSGAGYVPIASSPLASSPMGAASGAGLYTTSSAELKSFGGGGNGGAAMGGASRANSVSNPSLQGGAGVGFISSPISYTSARRSEVGGTSGTNPAMMAQQGMTPDMASAGNFGYAAASNYLNAGTYDQYNAMYGGMGRSNVRGRQNAPSTNDVDAYNQWKRWLAMLGYRFGSDSGDNTYSFDGEQAYQAFLIWYKSVYGKDYETAGYTPEFTYDQWIQWFCSNGGTHGYTDGTNSWTFMFTPVGDVLPLFLLAMFYIVFVAFKSKKVSTILKSLFTKNKNNK